MNDLNQVNQIDKKQVPFEAVQHNLANIKPTAPEIGYLWSSYLAESTAVCMLKYIVAKSKDPDYKPLFELALNLSNQRINSMDNLFNSLNHPIPEAFGEKDVDINAKELYSESFLVIFMRHVNGYIMQHYTQAFTLATRKDFRECFLQCINTTSDLYQKTTDVLLAKGLLEKPPYLATPDRIDYVHEKSYYGTVLFGSKRPLNALEISYLFDEIQAKFILQTYFLGFRQVVKDEKLKDYFIRGNKITDKQIDVLSDILENEDLPVPKSLDFEVTTSTESPFSDRLMLFYYTTVLSYTILGYGCALTNSARKDVIVTFNRLISEILDFAKDGTDLMIERRWLEQPPQTASRSELIQ